MSVKMICIDLDGTLFNGKRFNKISKGDREAIYNAYENKIPVVIATGRLFNNAAAVSRSLKIKCPVISSNGSIVSDEKLNTILYKNMLLEECLKISRLVKKYKLIAHFYTKDRIIPNNIKAFVIADIYKYLNLNKEFKINIDKVFTYKKLNNKFYKYKDQIVKCVIYSSNKLNIEKFKEEISKDKNFTICGDGEHSLELTAKDVSKGEAVRFLSEYLEIKKNEILCIGDNENDISMMKNSGKFAAMGNGIEALRKSADYVTDTNKKCGVAKAINKFLH